MLIFTAHVLSPQCSTKFIGVTNNVNGGNFQPRGPQKVLTKILGCFFTEGKPLMRNDIFLPCHSPRVNKLAELKTRKYHDVFYALELFM